jgi:glutamate/tyrosine decarboxylase-like PLP-dependent enzyme
MVEKVGYDAAKHIPSVQKQLADEKEGVRKSLEADLKTKTREMGEPLFALPEKGQSAESILSLMKNALVSEDEIWENGKVSGCVYHGGRDHQKLLNTAYSLYSLSNPLHPDIWPSASKFEAEIIAMCANMMTPDKKCTTVCGSTTSGGTESILLAVKTHRLYYAEKYNITEPEIIACDSAHAAIDKACELLNIRLIKLPMDPVTFKLDTDQVKRAISPNTIMMYGSAPTFPQGVIDDITGLSRLAVQYDIGLHVDMCLGGFILPFAKKMGYNVPEFDFDLPGVTSMSVDTHKFGYALKGSSVVLYRTPELRRAQYFTCPKWPGGLYSTPAIAGSRSAGLIAQCWASMVALGEEGYMKNAKVILDTVKEMARGLSTVPELEVIGQSQAMIVCFRSKDPKALNIYAVGDGMSKKGWSLNLLQNPASIHLCVTVQSVGKTQLFISELKEVIAELAASGTSAVGGTAAIYGMATTLPEGPIDEMMKAYQDVVYMV